MTEKRFECCGLCSHFSRGKWNSSKGLFDHYCNVLKKDVSIIGYACPDFKRRVPFGTGTSIAYKRLDAFCLTEKFASKILNRLAL